MGKMYLMTCGHLIDNKYPSTTQINPGVLASENSAQLTVKMKNSSMNIAPKGRIPAINVL